MLKNRIHKKIVDNIDELNDWFEKRRKNLYIPFFSSYDIRDSSFKFSNIDANIFPAGFNNICTVDKENADALVNNYFKQHYSKPIKNILLMSEENTKNPYYWNNISSIKKILEEAGCGVQVVVPGIFVKEDFIAENLFGEKIPVKQINCDGAQIYLKDFEHDLIVNNNDFSVLPEKWCPFEQNIFNPSPELGWHRRQKHLFFEKYNLVAKEFAEILGEPSFFFDVNTELFKNFDLSSDISKQALADAVDRKIDKIKVKYKEFSIDENPYVFIKNNAGTYGLGVTQVSSGSDVLEWSYKQRKKMKAAKGGGGIQEVIIQEGIPTSISSEGATAEPAIYMIGSELAGGFLRTHDKKGPKESLNSPGAVYKRMCVSDLKIDLEGKLLENVFGWIAKIGLLAVGLETQEMGIDYKSYIK